MKTLLDSANPNGHNPQGICLNKVKDWWGLMLRQRHLLFKSLLLICQKISAAETSARNFNAGWGEVGGWEELEGIWLHNRKTAESGLVLWEVGALLRERFKLAFCGSSTAPNDSQPGQTVNNPHCSSNLTNPGRSRDFMNNLWYLMSAREWKWLETRGLGGNLMLQLVKKLSFFIKNARGQILVFNSGLVQIDPNC